MMQLLFIVFSFIINSFYAYTWADVDAAFDACPGIVNGTLLIGLPNGTFHTRTKGTWDPDTAISVASATKWVSGFTFETLIAAGKLSPSDNPQKYISWWTNDTADPRSQITLEMILSFKSGFDDAQCPGNNSITLDACVRSLYDGNLTYAPGTTYTYGAAHFPIASLMAQISTGLTSFNTVFNTYVRDNPTYAPYLTFNQDFGPFTSTYTPLTGDNQDAAGTFITSTNVYASFLKGLLNKQLLQSPYVDDMLDSHLNGVTIARSPVTYTDPPGYTMAWKYGYGNWVECNSTTYDSVKCGRSNGTNSSPGKFGFYPWVNWKYNYYGIVAQLDKVTFRAGMISVECAYSLRFMVEDILATTITTNAPTTSVTNSPTNSPTNVPLGTPTNAPTVPIPTNAPTTFAPTPSPTNVPLGTPTRAPTNFVPTATPTNFPTRAPTSAPTMPCQSLSNISSAVTSNNLIVRLKINSDSDLVTNSLFVTSLVSSFDQTILTFTMTVSQPSLSSTNLSYVCNALKKELDDDFGLATQCYVYTCSLGKKRQSSSIVKAQLSPPAPSSGLSTGAIVGIVVGSILGFLLIIVIILLVFFSSQTKKEDHY